MKNQNQISKIFISCFLVFFVLLTPSFGFGQANEKAKALSQNEIKFEDQLDLSKNYFSSKTRLGLLLSTGNTGSIAVNGEHQTTYRIKRFENHWHLGAYYHHISDTRTDQNTGTISNYIFGTYRLDYYFLPLSTFYVGGGGYSDEIKGIDYAALGFAGATHYLIHNKKISLRTGLGYEFSYEDRALASNQKIHSATSEIDFKYQFIEHALLRERFTLKIDPQELANIRFQSQTDLEVKLVKNFSLITSFIARFDGEPTPGYKKLDTLTSVSLALSY